ncbi:MAG TPA: peptidase, partial [Flavobacteriaceae bacterium]|nr:peptidase [Flavobacteriaceae bacterium]
AFLQEAAVILKNEKLKELSTEITEIGNSWRDFALDASRIYKNRSPEIDAYNKVADQLVALSHREEEFFKKLRKAI